MRICRLMRSDTIMDDNDVSSFGLLVVLVVLATLNSPFHDLTLLFDLP